MRLYDLIKLYEPTFDYSRAKVHLARPGNDGVHPMDVWLDGGFEEWQRWQKHRNFGRELVLSLIQVPKTNRWMFAGLYRSHGYTTATEPTTKGAVNYKMERLASTADLEGRLFVAGDYTDRNSYLYGETLVDDMAVHELLAEKKGDGDFPGYNQVDISKAQLDRLVRTASTTWTAALSHVAGIYLLTDSKTGKLYVGKADGKIGIWHRWSQYASTGHGWNKALMEEFGIEATDRQLDLHFAILEVLPQASSAKVVTDRETYWKQILMTRQTGYNRN